jgi:hypothetical protein
MSMRKRARSAGAQITQTRNRAPERLGAGYPVSAAAEGTAHSEPGA